MTTEQDVLAAAAAVVDSAPVEVIRCTVQLAPGITCEAAARFSLTAMESDQQAFMCTPHLLFGGIGQLGSGFYYMGVVS